MAYLEKLMSFEGVDWPERVGNFGTRLNMKVCNISTKGDRQFVNQRFESGSDALPFHFTFQGAAWNKNSCIEILWRCASK